MSSLPRKQSVRAKIRAGLIRSFSKAGTNATGVDFSVSRTGSSGVAVRPSRVKGATANSSVMPYLMVVEDNDAVELRGSTDGLTSSHLFSKFGMDVSTSTKGRDLKKIKLEYFSLLEKGGFYLVSSTACTCDGHIVREYLFRRHHSIKRTSLDGGGLADAAVWKFRETHSSTSSMDDGPTPVRGSSSVADVFRSSSQTTGGLQAVQASPSLTTVGTTMSCMASRNASVENLHLSDGAVTEPVVGGACTELVASKVGSREEMTLSDAE